LSALGKELESFLRDLAEKNLVAPQSATLMTLMHHQELIITLESNLYQLVKLVQAAPASDAMRQLTQTFVEALDVILYSTIDALDSQDPVDIDTLVLMTSDQGQVLEEMRHTYLQRESGFTSVEKASILLVSNIFERAVWITNQVGRLLRTVRERAAPSA
jgi:membrane-anchored protein YejM (alkaline phosphatase superfamily)